FAVPEFPVAISLGELAIPSVIFGQSVFGLAAEVELKGNLQLEGGNLQTGLDIVRLDGPGGTLDLTIDYKKADNSIALDLSLVEPENGVIANLLNIENKPAVTLTLKGNGPVADLRTELALQANDQLALSGVATIAQSAAGFAINADLGGPLSMLLAEPYRPFFGANTALSARALLRAEGGLSLEALQLSGGQLRLQATAETTTDYFLKTLVLDAAIADPAGGVVTLPVPGTTTRVGSAQFNIDFGRDGSEDWASNLAIANFETSGFGARDLSFKIGGVASNLSDPSTRRVTFNGDGALSGLAAAEEIVAALGDSVGLGIAGLWNAGQPVELAQLRIAGGVLSAALSGQLDGLDFNGEIAVETASIAPFSGMAGRDLQGALSLKASGDILPLTGGFDLTLDGTGTDLSIGDDLADRLLTGMVDLSGRLARTTEGLIADNFRLANDQVQLLADGNYSTELADFKFNLDLADLALLSDEASGKLSVVGTAKGVEKVIDLDLDASVANGTLSDRALRNGTIGFSGRYNVDRLDGAISGSAELDSHRTALKGDVAVNSVQQALTNLDFTAVGTSISGG
ncbi:MAG TPA: translocation/assembly module TamB, partial [Devosia sp.]|nr:translocation/assembly module TamB [Devosia sp.]